MTQALNRRDFLQLLTVGGVAFASGCAQESIVRTSEVPGEGQKGRTRRPKAAGGDAREGFFFLQISDTHWGFRGDPNPEAQVTLRKAIATINGVETKPDFVVFTGDLTHTTDDPKERRARMGEVKEIIAELNVPTRYYLPGEHDASLDGGAAFHEQFGESRYSFDHKGVHFVALDNASDPTGSLGEAQIDWLRQDLAGLKHGAPIIVLAHRPLFDLYPAWDWATRDGARAVSVLEGYPDVTVFYGHIHQEHHHATGHIQHHAARSLVFPLPAPGSAPKKAPVPWSPDEPFRGLGTREITVQASGGYRLEELPVVRT